MKPGEHDVPDEKPPNFLQVLGSALSAAFGVQNRKNRERDFKHGKASTFIIAGVLLAATFVLLICLLVRIVLRAAGQG